MNVFAGGLPRLGIGVGEDQSLVRHDLEVDAAVRHVLPVGPAHHDQAGTARPVHLASTTGVS